MKLNEALYGAKRSAIREFSEFCMNRLSACAVGVTFHTTLHRTGSS